jgi:hypothetical protein
MVTLMPSACVGIVGIVVTAILMAANRYIWDFRYWAARQRASALGRTAHTERLIHLPSASGRELVVNLAGPSPEQTAPPRPPVENEWAGPWA